MDTAHCTIDMKWILHILQRLGGEVPNKIFDVYSFQLLPLMSYLLKSNAADHESAVSSLYALYPQAEFPELLPGHNTIVKLNVNKS